MRNNFTPDREDRLKLYEINDEMDAVLSVASDEDFDPEKLDELDLIFDDKASGCVAFIKNLRAHQKAIREERKRLEAKEKTASADEESLKAYLAKCMRRAEKTEAGKGIHTAKFQRNSQPSVTVMDDSLVPDRFVEIKYEVKRSEIAKWYKTTGEIVDGVDIIEGEHLRIG